MNRQAVENLFKSYHNKIGVQPNLYRQAEYVQIVLPAELKEYSNAAAGHGISGPIGIRLRCDNPAKEIARIFSSVDTLESFIRSSDANALHSTTIGSKTVKVRMAKKRRPISVRSGFWSNYTKYDLEHLKEKFGYETILEAFNSTMTFDEFRVKFALK